MDAKHHNKANTVRKPARKLKIKKINERNKQAASFSTLPVLWQKREELEISTKNME